MNSLLLEQIRRITAAAVSVPLPPISATSIATDTRQMQAGSLFIAIRGETHDGHDHLQQAARNGAVAALVQSIPADAPVNFPLLRVDDTRRAMGLLAGEIRRNFRGKVIAVAGSNGKTTTKNLVHAALKPNLRGSASPKSFNNDIGVPLTIFNADPTDDYLILELGTNHPGELLNLTSIARPDIAIITNIGAEHLEFFHDLDGVRAEEAAVAAGVPPTGLLILNGDDPQLLKHLKNHPARKITFGMEATNDLIAAHIRCSETHTLFSVNDTSQTIHLPLIGRHNAVNALAAIAVGQEMGLTAEQLSENLSHAQPSAMRLQLEKVGPLTLINDVYNANPSSMRAALETLRDLPASGRRIAVLGDMLELGDTADEHHKEIGRLAAACHLDELHCIGPKSELIALAAAAAGLHQSRIRHFPTAPAAASALTPRRPGVELILLKASRGIHLETVASALTQSSE